MASIAEVFGDLQGLRHRADYDIEAEFQPEDVNALIDRVCAAMAAWREIKDHPAARLYLLSLLVWERIKSVR